MFSKFTDFCNFQSNFWLKLRPKKFLLIWYIICTGRVRLLLSKGHSCYRPRRDGERKRKSVRGCIVDSNLSVLALVIIRKGKQVNDHSRYIFSNIEDPCCLGCIQDIQFSWNTIVHMGDEIRFLIWEIAMSFILFLSVRTKHAFSHYY